MLICFTNTNTIPDATWMSNDGKNGKTPGSGRKATGEPGVKAPKNTKEAKDGRKNDAGKPGARGSEKGANRGPGRGDRGPGRGDRGPGRGDRGPHPRGGEPGGDRRGGPRGPARGESHGGGRWDARFRGPRMDMFGKEVHVFVSMPDRFFDDAIRADLVLPVSEMFNFEKLDTVVYKAKGQAINVAVRAALLLEQIMGAMKKDVSISSEMARPRESPGDAKSDGKRPSTKLRMVPSIDIKMKRIA